MISLGLFHLPQGAELLIIALFGLLIFGRKLPDLGRSLGKGIVEFKKGLKGMKEEMDEVNKDVREAERKIEQEVEQAKLDATPPPKAKVEEKSEAAVGERSEHH